MAEVESFLSAFIIQNSAFPLCLRVSVVHFSKHDPPISANAQNGEQPLYFRLDGPQLLADGVGSASQDT